MTEWARSLSPRGKQLIFGWVFVADAFLVLFPGVYWVMGAPGWQRPIPLSIVYFMGTGWLIALSISALRRVERARGELD